LFIIIIIAMDDVLRYAS